MQAVVSEELFAAPGRPARAVDGRIRSILSGTPAEQDFRLSRYKVNSRAKVRTALAVIFELTFWHLSRTESERLVQRFLESHTSTSPVLIDLRDTFGAFVDGMFRGTRRAAVAELAAVDRARGAIVEDLATEPGAKTASGFWLNPNLRLLRSSLPLDRVWAAAMQRAAMRLRRERAVSTYALLVSRSGLRVERLAASEERAVRRTSRVRPAPEVLASLFRKNVLLAPSEDEAT